MNRRTYGFTLPELMVTLVVMSLLAMVVLPSMLTMVAKNRVEGVASELRTDLQYARSEAIRLRRSVTVSVASGGASYSITYVDDAGTTQTAKSVSMPTGTTVSATSNVVFESSRGHASTTGDLTISNANANGELKVTVSTAGTPSTCKVSGSFYGVSATCSVAAETV